ncbi:MBL fold metallo-hydrolase [Nocardioides mangrovicus]|uniref:MBL fold metallo-hydrolase n=1 Tax=Nocardioides mangrovicus TaxID=2478913 RepID=UPI001E560111|nr:MBL fold metallo-hydrolase [Nocardioides mangrovicus]
MSDQTWTEPGAYQVADGVHRVPLPLPMDGLRAVNVYVIETGDGLTLIDGGWAIPESRPLLEQALGEIGYALRDIRRFLVTHVHRDHYTQAVAVRREVGSHVSLGIGDKPALDLVAGPRTTDPFEERFTLAGAYSLYGAWRDLVTEPPDRRDWEQPDGWLEGDVRVELDGRALDAVATPGHTQGHYVFADREAGLLFAGDHVLPTITPSIGFEAVYTRQPLRDFLASLAKVRALPDLRLLPAHGAVTESSHTRIDELVGFHDARLAASLAAVADGAHTAWEAAQLLPWTKRERRASELDAFDAALAAFETLHHLELLALRGDLVRTELDGTVRFSMP